MDPKELRVSSAAKFAEAKALAAPYKGKEAEMPADVETKINGLLGEYDVLKAKADLADRLGKAEGELGQPAANPVSWRDSGHGEGEEEVDNKAWRAIEAETMWGKRQVRYYVPLRIDAIEKGDKKQYTKAFEAYLCKRGGPGSLGPTDYKTLTEGTDSAGGFVVPPDFQAMIIKKTMTRVAVRANAFISTTSRDSQQWPKINYSTDDNFTSGIRLTWTGEAPATATTHRVTDPVVGMYTVPVHTAMASIPLSNDLLEDQAVDVAGISSDLFAEAFSLGEDNVFINGTGAGQPMGLIMEIDGNGPASQAGTGSNTFTGDDLIKLFYKVPVQYRAQGKWLMNSPAMQVAELLKDSQGRYLVTSILQASLATTQIDVLKGKPIVIDEFMPAVTTNNFPVVYGDLSGYMVLDRVGLSIQKLQEVYAELNVTLLLGRKRVGGYCIRPWQLKALKIS